MIEISSTFRAPSLLSPRTANYVAALIRQGDNFDYFKWLQKVRDDEGQAKQIPATFTSGKIIAPEIDPPIGTADCQSASLNSGPAPMTRAAPLSKARSHHEPRNKTPKARTRAAARKDSWCMGRLSGKPRSRCRIWIFTGGVRNRRAFQSTAKDQEASAACVQICSSSIRQER